MIPAAPFEALQSTAQAHSSARVAGEYMGQIHRLLSESLPALEALLERSCRRGPAPLDAAAEQLVLAGRPVLTEPNALWFAVGVPGAVLGLVWDGRIRMVTVFALTLAAIAGVIWGGIR